MDESLSRLNSDTPSSKRTQEWSIREIGFKKAVTPTMKMRQSKLKFNFAGDRRRPGTIRSARRIVLIAFFASGFWVSAPLSALAEGFRILPPGASNLGRAGGRIAQIDDSSAVHQNPANLVYLANPEIQLTPAIVYVKSDFTSANGQTSSTEEPWKPLPNLFAAMPLHGGRFAVGLGITTPYGLANQWNDQSGAFAPLTGILRYQSPFYAKLTTINFNPTVAVKLGEHFSLGAGLDVMWSKVTLKQYYPWFLATGNLTDPDGLAQAEADGTGAGANFGLTWRITERHRLAFTCRTPVHIDYEGDFRVNNVPDALGGGTLSSSFKTNIKFPTILAAGYGIEFKNRIRLETDVEWLQFSNFKNLPLESVAAAGLGFPSSIPENWRDTFTVGIGGDWKFVPDWILRAGYQFYQSPVPDSTFSPSIPDANQNVPTIGLGYTHQRHSFEASYGLDFYDERNIKNAQNSAFNGKYQNSVHLFSFAYHFSF